MTHATPSTHDAGGRRGPGGMPTGHGHDGEHHAPHDANEWDEWYAGGGSGTALWSGRPNGALVAEAADLLPGTALDVGCGEGADAIWLAQRGWRVTALDPSRVALDRGRVAAGVADVAVTWLHAGLLDVPGGTGTHDLVSAQYPALLHSDDDAAVSALLTAVAPGGTLLLVHHRLDQDHAVAHAEEHGFDPEEYVGPHDVAAHLTDGWVVEVLETRPRPGPLPADAHHVDDVVLRARRRSTDAG